MNDLQRTEDWFLARKGKITASECYVLLANHKEDVLLTAEEQEQFRAEHPRAKMPETKKVELPFSEATFTYLDGKVAEMYMPDGSFTEYVETARFETRAMQHGTFWEDTARTRYSEKMDYEVLDAPFIPLKGFEKFAGGSPDGIVRYQDGIIEIKCPFNPAVHLRYFMLQTPQELMAENLQYYCQMQYNMLVASREFDADIKFCDFVSFDPRTSRSKQLKVMRIPRDKDVQDMLLQRTEQAVRYMREKIEQIDAAKDVIIENNNH